MITKQLIFKDNKFSDPLPTELDSEQCLIFISSPLLDPTNKVVVELVKYFPKSHIVGCTSAGSISTNEIFDHEIVISVIHFEKTFLKSKDYSVTKEVDPLVLGNTIVSEFSEPIQEKKLSHILLISEGIHINGSHLVQGLEQKINLLCPNVTVSGGLSSDGLKFQKTWIVHNSLVDSDKVMAIGFYGDQLDIGLGSFSGWDHFGPERKVTAAKANVLFELDDQPALDLYKSYLGENLTKDLPGSAILFPLAIQNSKDLEIIRTIVGINKEDQSLIFAGDIPVGSTVRIMRPIFNKLISASYFAVKMALNKIDINKPCLCLAISCVGRRAVLGERCEDELEMLVASLPAHSVVSGFYSNGEINYMGNFKLQLLNQTMSLTLIQEKVS